MGVQLKTMKVIYMVAVGVVALSGNARAESSTYGQRIVASVLMGEAASEGELGMTAVAEVIRNRASGQDKTPLQVVCQKGAFSCLNGKTPEGLYQQHFRSPAFKTALRIAKTLYNAPEQLPDRTRGATFYDIKGATPPWLCDVHLVAVVGNHSFYADRRKLAARF